MQKTNKTKEYYLLTSNQLFKKFEEETGLSFFDSPEDFLKWFKKKSEKWRKQTFYAYRASLTYYFQKNNLSIHILNKINEITYTKKEGIKEERTSSKKQKKCSKEDLKKILEFILNNDNTKLFKSKYIKLTGLWLYANWLTGLRPSEWQNAELLQNNILKVKNAKATNNRSFGTYRYLDLSHFREEELNIVKNFIILFKSFVFKSNYQKVYNNCRTLLLKINSKLNKNQKDKNITLYSPRHQVTADMKKSGYTKQEIAYILGHKTDLTATIHYGRKISGELDKSLPKIPHKQLLEKITHKEKVIFQKNAKDSLKK